MNLYAQAVLLERWTEPHRHYHSLTNHLLPMIKTIAGDTLSPHERSLLSRMAWWHDAVCWPGAKDNEERSVELMRLTCDCDAIDYRVDRAILATKSHLPTDDALIDYFLTVDLLPLRIFAPEVLHRNEELLWAEYRQVYGVEEYVEGRLRFLRGLIGHPLIPDTTGVEWMMRHIEAKYQRGIDVDIDARR